MKKTVFAIFLCAAFTNLFSQEIPTAANLPLREKNPSAVYPVSVEYPLENASFGAIKGIAVFGSVADKKATLKVNGSPVPVYKTGGWLTYVPLEPGDNEILIEVESNSQTYAAVRRVKTADPSKNCALPAKDIIARAGDVLELAVCGDPGQNASFKIKGVAGGQMTESAPGRYTAAYTVLPKDHAKAARVTYTLNKKTKITARGETRILKEKEIPLFGHAPDTGLRARSAPVTARSLHKYHRLHGPLKIDGKKNGLYRIFLDENNIVWTEEKPVKLISKNTIKPNIISHIESAADEEKTKMVFFSGRRAPFTLSDEKDAFYVTFFYTNEFTENYILSLRGSFINRIEHRFLSAQTLRFKLSKTSAAPLWGFDHSYDDNGNFILYLYHKPSLPEPTKTKPLSGIKIFLDPGHSPRRKPNYDGVIGPTGLFEYEANMTIAKELSAKLSAAGAQVIMSKTEKEQTSLTERVQRALDAKAHIFVSLHNNALPIGADPFSSKRGLRVYYFNRHSRALAESINKKMSAAMKPFQSDGVFEDDLFVARTPQMPAVLVESVFMKYPEQEKMLLDASKRAKIVQGVYDGIFDFFGRTPPPAPKPKPKNKKGPRAK